MKKYFKATEEDLDNGRPGAVVAWSDGVLFQCPCDERQVYIASPPHTISFDEIGLLTITRSIGYRANPDLTPPRPANWCHFFITQGLVEMCSDAQCPGGSK